VCFDWNGAYIVSISDTFHLVSHIGIIPERCRWWSRWKVTLRIFSGTRNVIAFRIVILLNSFVRPAIHTDDIPSRLVSNNFTVKSLDHVVLRPTTSQRHYNNPFSLRRWELEPLLDFGGVKGKVSRVPRLVLWSFYEFPSLELPHFWLLLCPSKDVA
jgi:hypothetical protein